MQIVLWAQCAGRVYTGALRAQLPRPLAEGIPAARAQIFDAGLYCCLYMYTPPPPGPSSHHLT